MIAIDFETHLIGPGAIFPKPVCVSSYNGQDAQLYTGAEMGPFLQSILQSETIIAHNAVFECGVIYHHFPTLINDMFKALEEGRIICTKINEELDNLTREKVRHTFSLSDLVKDYFKVDISASKTEDAWRLRYSELEGIPKEDWPEEAVKYALDDSIWAYDLYNAQKKTDLNLSVKSGVYLNIMASKGMKVDLDRVAKLKEEILNYLNPRYTFLINKGLCTKDKKDKIKKNIKDLKEYIQSLNINMQHTRKGSISVTGESFDFYLNQVPEDEVLKAFSEISIYEKVLTAYISRMEISDTIWSSYSTVKSTGRTSSNSSNLFPSLNIQQMPRSVPNVSYDIRNCFVPNEGFKILSIDYMGLELCATAHQLKTVFKKSAMLDALNKGDEPTDMHSMLAARIKGISYEEFMQHKKDFKDVRQLAKPINLGFPGGIGYDTMRHLLWMAGIKTTFNILHTEPTKREIQHYYWKIRDEFPSVRICRTGKNQWSLVEDELVKLKRDFFDLYPELEQFLKEIHHKFETDNFKWVLNDFDEWEKEPMYKYNVMGFKRNYCTYTAFCNGFLMQTPSAVGAKKAVSEVIRRFHNHPDIRPLAFIHDEILFEIRESRKDLAREAAEIMIDEMQAVLTTPRVTVELSMSHHWEKADGFWTETMFKNPT